MLKSEIIHSVVHRTRLDKKTFQYFSHGFFVESWIN